MRKNHLRTDLLIIAVSVAIAVILLATGALHTLLTSTEESRLLGSLVAGFFFTSVFTTAPAMIALGEISTTGSIITTALLGGLGATFGDLILFRFVRDRLGDDIRYLAKLTGVRRYTAIFRSHLFHRFVPMLGALVIASPLPDELGLLMMGIPKMQMRHFLPLAFVMNTLGIIVIGLVANAVTS